MSIATGIKEKLSFSKGSEIEVSSDEYVTGNVWYCAILEDNLATADWKKISVRYLDPLLKQDYSPPLTNTTRHRLIRPVPPPDLFPDVGFEEGEEIDAVHDGGWWAGSVIKVLGNGRYLVYLQDEAGAIEIERKDLRPRMYWREDEWFRCEKEQLIEYDFSAGKAVEIRTEVDNLGDVWRPEAKAIKENEDGTLLVKMKIKRYKFTKISLPYSKVRPSPPRYSFATYKLMDKVDARLDEFRWCPGVVSQVLSKYDYVVVFGRNKESKKFDNCHLRHSVELKDGIWFREVSGSQESPHEGIITPSTRKSLTIPTDLGDQKIALATEKEVRVTHSSDDDAMENPPPISSNGVDVAETGKGAGTERKTLVPYTSTHLTGELGSKLDNTVNVIKENTPATREQEIGATNEFHSPVVLGIAAATLTKPVVETQGKTSPRKKIQAMKNQKGSANDSDGEKAPKETKIREIVNKRKRKQPRKFISTEPKQKTGVAANGSNAAIMLNSVVEKHVDVVETPPAKEPTMVLPFAKKSPVWKVLESMEVFKEVPQHPHFSPLLDSEEELREGVAIGTMVMYTSLLERVNNIQVDHPISSINRVDECLLKLEKHGFNVTKPRSRIAKILSIKERQTCALEELKAVEEKITESDNKRRKYEEDIAELQRAKVSLDMEIAQMQSRAAVLDQKVQNVDQDFRAIVAAPW